MVTPELLTLTYNCTAQRALLWAPLLAKVCEVYELTTRQRVACFLAQVGHESGRLRYTKELWGPTAQQRRYEPGTTLAKRLGNVQEGDGARYMGRGLIQVTGRAGYRAITQALRKRFPALKVPNFEANPAALQLPLWSALSAGEFWALRNLNRYADAYDFVGLTKRINGGTNGLADRQRLYAAALPALLLTGN